MATYLADRVIVFEGKPSVDTTAHTPQSLLNGMNRFLELLEITFRRDPNNFRPRINKTNSVKVGSESGVFFSIEKHKLNYFLSIHRIRSRSAQVNTSSTKSLKFHRARTFRSLFNWYQSEPGAVSFYPMEGKLYSFFKPYYNQRSRLYSLLDGIKKQKNVAKRRKIVEVSYDEPEAIENVIERCTRFVFNCRMFI